MENSTSERRREFLRATIGGSVFWLVTSGGITTLAADEIAIAISKNAENAESLLRELLKTPQKRIHDRAPDILERELKLRLELAKVLSEKPQDTLLKYVRDEQQSIAVLLIQTETPLVPSLAELQEEKPKKVEPEGETSTEIVIDIIFDVLDLLDVKEAIKELVKQSPDLEARLNDIAQTTVRKDWEELFDKIVAFLVIVGSSQFVYRLWRHLGHVKGNALVQKIAKAYALRMVPFIGWAYAIIVIIVALMKHLPRLFEAIENEGQ